jgi:hypothetical protein
VTLEIRYPEIACDAEGAYGYGFVNVIPLAYRNVKMARASRSDRITALQEQQENFLSRSVALKIECIYSHKTIAGNVLLLPIATTCVASNAGIAPEFLPEKTGHHIVDRFFSVFFWMTGPAHFVLRDG